MYYVRLSPQQLTPLTHSCELLPSSQLYPSHNQQNKSFLHTISLSIPPTYISCSSSSSLRSIDKPKVILSLLLPLSLTYMKGRLNMEEVKSGECEREAKETEHEEDTIHTIVFTAGTVLLMVCLKHFLVEQWRAWVFLILNLILLAILFMSLRPRRSANEGIAEEVKNDKTEKKGASEFAQEINDDAKDCYKEQCCWTRGVEDERDEKEEEEAVVEAEDEAPRLSKEELNERAEAFIAMFRQHLASDARGAENYRFQKNSNMTPKGLKCLIVEA